MDILSKLICLNRLAIGDYMLQRVRRMRTRDHEYAQLDNNDFDWLIQNSRHMIVVRKMPARSAGYLDESMLLVSADTSR